jgi:hypothetical protein
MSLPLWTSEKLIERFDGCFYSFFVNRGDGANTIRKKPPQIITLGTSYLGSGSGVEGRFREE